MSTNISLSFLIVTGALLSAQATIAQNSFSSVQSPVANNTLKTQVSVADSFTNIDPVEAKLSQTQTIASTLQTDVFASDVATIPQYSNKISGLPAQSNPNASVEIPVPAPRTQIIPGQPLTQSSQSIKIDTPSSSIGIPINYPTPTANSVPRSRPTNSIDNGGNNSSAIAIYPLTNPATITSKFGWRTHPLTGNRRFHSGIDIAAPSGAPVVATGSGIVISAGWNGGYGKAIVIQHNDTQQTLYGHLSEISVQPGQKIDRGTVIGLVGSTGNSTGPHLHFESRTSTTGAWVAVDPGLEIQYAVDTLRRSMPYAQKDLPPGI
jgi:murein DD-endopeptidase MepM/ murein hydrolase activator NlpD